MASERRAASSADNSPSSSAVVFGASATIVSPSGKITFIFGGTNLTDKRYITTGQPQVAGGVVFGTYNPPREWYATLGLKY